MKTYVIRVRDIEDADIVENFIRNLGNMTKGPCTIDECRPLPSRRRKSRARTDKHDPARSS